MTNTYGLTVDRPVEQMEAGIRLFREACRRLRPAVLAEHQYARSLDDSSSAVLRVTARALEEAVGERVTRLMKERPEGQWLKAGSYRLLRARAGCTEADGTNRQVILASEHLILMETLLEACALADESMVSGEDGWLSSDIYWEPQAGDGVAPWVHRAARFESALGSAVVETLGATSEERLAALAQARRELTRHERALRAESDRRERDREDALVERATVTV